MDRNEIKNSLEYRASKSAIDWYQTHQKADVVEGFEEGYKQGYEQGQKDLGWHSVEESLPPYDEEVIALTDMMHGKQLSSARCICYAHRPNPKGYNGRSIITGKVSHYEPMTYNGWNIEGVKYWMPCPKILE